MGRAVVAAALSTGDCVVATVRDRRALGDLQDSNVRRLRVMPVQNATSGTADAVIDFALEAFGRLDVLVKVSTGEACSVLEQAALPVMCWEGARQVFDIIAGALPEHPGAGAACCRAWPTGPVVPGPSALKPYPLERTTIWLSPTSMNGNGCAKIADEIVNLSARVSAFATA